MNITANTVKELRERTGAGMMDCKRALAEVGGDMEKAIDNLRKAGLAKAAKKAARSASEGLIGLVASGGQIVMVEVFCETDFVCKTDSFQKFVQDIAGHIAKNCPGSMEELLASTMNGKKVADMQTEMVATIGENLGVRRFIIKKFDGNAVKAGSYVHAGSKIGVIVTFEDPNGRLTDTVAKDVAMHVAAMNPQYIRKSDVPADAIEREKEVFRGQMANEKKPPQILEKIIEGKVAKYLADVCLEDQIFIRDTAGKQTVGQMLSELDKGIKIKEMVRFQVGEKV